MFLFYLFFLVLSLEENKLPSYELEYRWSMKLILTLESLISLKVYKYTTGIKPIQIIIINGDIWLGGLKLWNDIVLV